MSRFQDIAHFRAPYLAAFIILAPLYWALGKWVRHVIRTSGWDGSLIPGLVSAFPWLDFFFTFDFAFVVVAAFIVTYFLANLFAPQCPLSNSFRARGLIRIGLSLAVWLPTAAWTITWSTLAMEYWLLAFFFAAFAIWPFSAWLLYRLLIRWAPSELARTEDVRENTGSYAVVATCVFTFHLPANLWL